jgi:hypothetical protein
MDVGQQRPFVCHRLRPPARRLEPTASQECR